MRLGFAVKVLGREGLKSNDSRRWQNNPHLRVSIEYANAIFDYLGEVGISMHRLSSDFAPYLTHPDLPQFHGQLDEARGDLEALGKRAREMNLRLSFHPSQYIILNSPSERLTEVSSRDFLAQARMLDIMEQGPEAVIVTHVGGLYGDRDGAIARFVQNFHALPEPAKRRLVLENDDVSFGVVDILRIHEQTGIRCIFDHQHHTCINDGEMSHEDACCRVMATWPQGCRPKIHFSSPRQEPRIIERRSKETGKMVQHEANPLLSQHADFIDVEVFAPFAREVAHRCGCAPGEGSQLLAPFDVMCEAKAKDLAVFHLRDDLATQAPDLLLLHDATPEQKETSRRLEREKNEAEAEVARAKEERTRLAAERKAAKEQAAVEKAAKIAAQEKAKKAAERKAARAAKVKAASAGPLVEANGATVVSPVAPA